MEKNNKKILNAWCSYDIANSVYNLIITAVLFPIYYQETTKIAYNSEMVSFMGIHIRNTVLYDYTISAAYLIIVFLSPILSGIADYTGHKKSFMRFFTYMGSIVCAGLYLFTGHNTEYGIFMIGLAVIGYSGSLVFYNSFLPLIASPDKHDALSAKGFSWGYAGSVLLLVFNIITINTYEFWGFSSKLDALRFSFLEVGIWWFCLSHIAFYYLKEPPTGHPIGSHIIKKGYKELVTVFKSFTHNPIMYRFLLAFFFYSMGVQTIMLVAAMFGSSVLHIESSKLIITVIILQLLGIVGANFFAWVSKIKGNKTSIVSMLIIWIVICICAYYIQNENQFYVIASMTGLIMGGIQSQSRSAFSKLIPQQTTDTASYFSFYDVTEKLAIVIGMFCFGYIEHHTGNMRNSTLALSGFFIFGLVIMKFVKFNKTKIGMDKT